MHAISYLLNLQIDHEILDGHGQACPSMSKEAFETYISQKLLSSKVAFWTPAFGWKGILWNHQCQYVSMSVGKHFFSKTAHRVFLEFHMKLEWPKGKKNCKKLRIKKSKKLIK